MKLLVQWDEFHSIRLLSYRERIQAIACQLNGCVECLLKTTCSDTWDRFELLCRKSHIH